MFWRSIAALCFSFLLLYNYSFAQQVQNEDTSFISKKTISIAAVSTVPAITLIDSYYMWWKDESRPFSFLDHTQHGNWLDERGSLGIDKIGHLYTSYFFYQTHKNILTWGGHSRETAIRTSAYLSAGLALLIEIGDGFSPYGFDYQDLAFNMCGLGYGLAQEYSSLLQHVEIKWSYIPTDALTFPPKFTEHYDGHIYWLSFKLSHYIDSSSATIVPRFLQPAIGFSVANGATRRELIVGLDWNFDFLFADNNTLLELAGKTLRLIHLPAPGVKFSAGAKPEWRIFLFH